jgi:hypothetical protein
MVEKKRIGLINKRHLGMRQSAAATPLKQLTAYLPLIQQVGRWIIIFGGYDGFHRAIRG